MINSLKVILIAGIFIFGITNVYAQSGESQDQRDSYVPPQAPSNSENDKPYVPPSSSEETKSPYIPPADNEKEDKIPIPTSNEISSSEIESLLEKEIIVKQDIEEFVSEPICRTGTESVNGICQVIQTEEMSDGGGCLIATATYGSEMAPQVQQLRELRDNQLLNTESGTAFMKTFNDVYYTFSPIIADYERENPYFKEAVKLAITPIISSLSLMENAESESEVLGIGISVIALNLGMYLGVPAVILIGIKKKLD